MKEVAVVIPVFGHNDLTHNLMEDIKSESDLVDTYIVDNKGDYEACGEEIILKSPTNLGWLRGTNYGVKEATKKQYPFVVFLNNDTRLSPEFFQSLINSYHETKAGLIGPMYDDVWLHQVVDKPLDAKDYVPIKRFDKVPFVDGTCMFLPRKTIDEVGLLDEDLFGEYGWGGELEYGLRVRNAGYDVVVTHLAYLNHMRGSTAKPLFPDYNNLAGGQMVSGLRTKWGEDWKDKILTYNGKQYQPRNYNLK